MQGLAVFPHTAVNHHDKVSEGPGAMGTAYSRNCCAHLANHGVPTTYKA